MTNKSRIDGGRPSCDTRCNERHTRFGKHGPNQPSSRERKGSERSSGSTPERARGVIPNLHTPTIFIPQYVQDRDEIINDQINNEFYIQNKLTKLKNIKSLPVRNILSNFFDSMSSVGEAFPMFLTIVLKIPQRCHF